MKKTLAIIGLVMALLTMPVVINKSFAIEGSERANIRKMNVERISNSTLGQFLNEIEESFKRGRENSLGFRLKNRLRFIGKTQGLEIHAVAVSPNRPTSGLKIEIKEFDEQKNDEEAKVIASHNAYSSTALKMDMVDSGWLNIPSFLITTPQSSIKQWDLTTKGYAANNKYSLNVTLKISKDHLKDKSKFEIERIRDKTYNEVRTALRNLSIEMN